MPATDRERDMKTLRNLIDEAHAVITMTDIPPDRTKRATKLLTSALELANDLIANPPTAAESIGKRGGMKTAQRGSEYFRQIAAKRKTKAGGRKTNERG